MTTSENTIYSPSTEGPGDLRYVSVDPSDLYDYTEKIRRFVGYNAVDIANALVDRRPISSIYLGHFVSLQVELESLETLRDRLYGSGCYGCFSGYLVRSTDSAATL